MNTTMTTDETQATQTTAPPPEFRATYSPDDNKLRLYALHRLPKELYERVKKAGFAWAPKQELFVAPAWTPEREDLLVELAGEIDDEDTSLAERQEARAERFEGYQERRGIEAERTQAAVERLADGIPLGQPILIGHHSERRARKDAERIRNGFAKAAQLWRTSEYWERRAKGAINLAKYKERPDVRYRRIKGLEADVRRHEKARQVARAFRASWEGVSTREAALKVANYDHSDTWFELDRETITWEDAKTKAILQHDAREERADRWLEHLQNRLAYERAMLGDQGGVITDKHDLKVGGQVLVDGTWATIIRVNVGWGQKVESVSTNLRNYLRVAPVERIRGYREPEAGAAEKVKAAKKLPPIVNYPGEGFRHMTSAEWDKVRRNTSGFFHISRVSATLDYAAHRRREAPPAAGPYYKTVGVYLTDMKRTDPPPLTSQIPKPLLPLEQAICPECGLPVSHRVHRGFGPCGSAPSSTRPETPKAKSSRPPASPAAALEARLKAGVEVVAVPGLYETPAGVAQHMIALAGIVKGHRVLEPSAGLGALVRPITVDIDLTLVELVPQLAERLRKEFPQARVISGDFLDQFHQAVPHDLRTFDRILMNPPFDKAEDIVHVLHARSLLAKDGLLVGICAGGPRQRAKLQPLATTWEPLPDGTFKNAGTMVSSVLFTMWGRS